MHAVALAWVIALASACSSDHTTWGLRFCSSALRSRAVTVETQVLAGGCTGTPVWTATFAAADGATPDAPGELADGRYGLSARARDAAGTWFASGCTEIVLPADGGASEVVTLVPEPGQPETCDTLDAGRADAGRVDAGGVDSGSVDSGSVDSGSVDSGGLDSGAPDSGSCTSATPWYPDVDGDGFGAAVGAVTACVSPGAGWTATAGDCDDACARCRPGFAGELCGDTRDNDCDGEVDDAACPCVLRALSTGTYLYCRDQSWITGRAMCMSFGGDLVVLETAEENSVVFAAMSTFGAMYLWFGATDAMVEGQWVWVNGSAMASCMGSVCTCAPGAYCNWHATQPNAFTADNCTVVTLGWPGDWGDWPCTTVGGAVCELP